MTGPAPGSSPRKKAFPRRLAELVRGLYHEELALWKAHYWRYFKIAARVLGLGFVLSFVAFSLWPSQEGKFLALVMKALKDIPLGAPPAVLALTLFWHNVRASLVAVAAGGLPFLCLPVFDPLLNGAALGLLASVSKHHGLNVPVLFLKSVAPHGIFELPAVLYATSVGVHLSVSLSRRILVRLRKRKEERRMAAVVPPNEPDQSSFLASYSYAQKPDLDIGSLVGEVARSFLIVVLPLLFIAAHIEAFITPMLY